MLALSLFAVAGTVIAGCSSPLPEVTFFAAGHTAATVPSQYCDAAMASCRSGPAGAVLSVPAGKPVQISVPSDVANSAWLIAFTYRQQNGQEVRARTEVFPKGSRYAYTLALPTPADQLEAVQVQQIGGIGQDDNGIEYVARSVWVLTASQQR